MIAPIPPVNKAEAKLVVYDREKVITFLEQEIEKTKRDTEKLDQENAVILADAKQARDKYIKAAYPLISEFSKKVKEGRLKAFDEETKEIAWKFANLSWIQKMKQSKGREDRSVARAKLEARELDVCQLNFKTGLIEWGSDSRCSDSSHSEFWKYCEERGVVYVNHEVTIREIREIGYVDVASDAISLEAYLECSLNRVSCMYGPTMNSEQFKSVRVFTQRCDIVEFVESVAGPYDKSEFESE